ncbi:MAG: oligoendopeptidase F [Chlamydiota bacterium]|nr:oligoendopeptidase F [Chlamydiota bacterium]
MVEERNKTEQKDCWNVESMYPSFSDWQTKFQSTYGVNGPSKWPVIESMRGKLGESPENVKTLLDHLFQNDRELSHLYTYAHLRHDENIADNENKAGFARITSVMHEFMQCVAWIDPELLMLPEDKIKEYLSSDTLKEYHFYLEKLLRMKKHTLPPSEEMLLALSRQALQGYPKAFGAINDADFDFGSVLDGNGKEQPLSHATYGLYMREHDRILRKNSFDKMHGQYEKYENTLSELLGGLVQSHVFQARARKFESCLEAALYPKNIDTSVYHSLVTAVNENIETLHKYIDLREKVMGVSPLHLYDMYVPMIDDFDMKFTFEEAAELIIASVAPLGKEYQDALAKGLTEDRWVDRYENKNKRSGAYSSGCYDSMPYILMNYKNVLRDVFTLAHEAGHSMHSYLSHKNQPYQYGDYPIFLAEVASTFNEELLMIELLKRAKSDKEKIFLINMKIEDIRATLFRQTMFAEFELMIHEKAEKSEPLTPQTLKEEFLKLNRTYFGPNVEIDEVAKIEWARIPHFYYNFYVYQYATGISAALALCDRVINGGEKERDDYLNFLKSGCSKYPVETLRLAGVDMSTPQPVKSAIDRFDTLVDDLGKLLKK